MNNREVMPLVGISGHIGSGKTTLATLIKEQDSEWEFKNFADRLKECCALLTGKEKEIFYTTEGKNTWLDLFGMTAGEMLQKIGTNALRDNFDKDVWVKSLLSDYKPLDINNDFSFPKWIIGDVRFENEAKYIKQYGGIIIRLEGDPASVRANSNRLLNHPSETSLDNYQDFDYIYHNLHGIEDLREFAKMIADRFK